LKLQSKPEETKAEFAARAQLAKREKRDAALDKLRERYASKVKRVAERIDRAEARVEREQSQYDQQKLQTGISMGATVLGALFGRRGLGAATSAARGAGRVARERDDVRRAEEGVRDLQDAMRALNEELEEAVSALQAEDELDMLELEEVIVRPRKSDIAVSDLKVAWKRD
jgi:molybdopterin converting factor small subunit